MAGGLLIDDAGACWADTSEALAHLIGYDDPALDFRLYAVRERGLIHFQPGDEGARVSLCQGAFTPAALAGLLYVLSDRAEHRVLLSLWQGTRWGYELHSDLWELAERLQDLSAGGPVELSRPWLATERRLAALHLPHFAALQPLVGVWRRARGRMTKELTALWSSGTLRNRTIFIRRPGGSSRLLVDHFGASISILRPCESFLLVGRDFNLPDRAYCGWCEEAYDRTLAGGRLRLESVVARISTSEAATVRIRYDRLLMPLRGPGRDAWMLCVSMRRELLRVA